MCDIICDVIMCCIRSFDVGEGNASDKIMFETRKMRQYGGK